LKKMGTLDLAEQQASAGTTAVEHLLHRRETMHP